MKIKSENKNKYTIIINNKIKTKINEYTHKHPLRRRFARVDMTDKVFGKMGILQDLAGNGEVERSFQFVDAATSCPSAPPPEV